MVERIRILFSKLFTKNKPKQTKSRFISDDIYNQRKKEKQDIIDNLLDKISKNGIDSLSEHEKEILKKF